MSGGFLEMKFPFQGHIEIYSTVMMLLNIVIRVFLTSPTIHDKNAMLILYIIVYIASCFSRYIFIIEIAMSKHDSRKFLSWNAMHV